MSEIKIAVEVSRIESLSPVVKLIEFTPTNSVLSCFSAGSHITVHMDEVGIKRSYSLISDPQVSTSYSIAVLLDEDSKGGSSYLHKTLKKGDQLFISAVENFFPVVEDSSSKHVLIAGGIGITPFLSYVYELDRKGLDFELHYCFRDAENAAFITQLSEQLKEKLYLYDGSKGERLGVGELVNSYEENRHFYVCGPTPLIDDVIEKGNSAVGESRVHYENFGELEVTGNAFEVYFKQSDFSLTIDENSSILQAIEADKRINIECLCRNGVCGTCETTLLEGEADHRDSYLDNDERESQSSMMICVSRAKGKRLVLDL
ncbi:PDR/VanB family oxidoreductase [Marinomonas sp.]|uniref:PDR/VanB family oxidoreductase n=1 Tax=Marinomonas sp. TaxID=1904862 RepID=UPI003F9493C5